MIDDDDDDDLAVTLPIDEPVDTNDSAPSSLTASTDDDPTITRVLPFTAPAPAARLPEATPFDRLGAPLSQRGPLPQATPFDRPRSVFPAATPFDRPPSVFPPAPAVPPPAAAEIAPPEVAAPRYTHEREPPPPIASPAPPSEPAPIADEPVVEEPLIDEDRPRPRRCEAAHSLPIYAELVVSREAVADDQRADVDRRFGVADARIAEALDRLWRQRLARSPDLAEQWELYVRMLRIRDGLDPNAPTTV